MSKQVDSSIQPILGSQLDGESSSIQPKTSNAAHFGSGGSSEEQANFNSTTPLNKALMNNGMT